MLMKRLNVALLGLASMLAIGCAEPAPHPPPTVKAPPVVASPEVQPLVEAVEPIEATTPSPTSQPVDDPNAFNKVKTPPAAGQPAPARDAADAPAAEPKPA